jgi:gamma-glutamyltranspeptidase/glutathione hydrolase
MKVAEATEAPRIHHQWLPDELRVETGISPDTVRLLEALGHKVTLMPVIGSTQTIERVRGRLAGAADTRQRGTGVAGY